MVVARIFEQPASSARSGRVPSRSWGVSSAAAGTDLVAAGGRCPCGAVGCDRGVAVAPLTALVVLGVAFVVEEDVAPNQVNVRAPRRNGDAEAFSLVRVSAAPEDA